MVDVTDVDVEINDEVVLIGTEGEAEIRLTELARAMGGIVEEILCFIPKSTVLNYLASSSTLESPLELNGVSAGARVEP